MRYRFSPLVWKTKVKNLRILLPYFETHHLFFSCCIFCFHSASLGWSTDIISKKSSVFYSYILKFTTQQNFICNALIVHELQLWLPLEAMHNVEKPLIHHYILRVAMLQNFICKALRDLEIRILPWG